MIVENRTARLADGLGKSDYGAYLRALADEDEP